MAKMEQALAQNDVAATAGLETEITLAAVDSKPSKKNSKKPKEPANGSHANNQGSKKVSKQTMGKCAKCGYISSQTICKACTLLEGLNKSRPKTAIGVNDAEVEGDNSLKEALSDVSIAAE